MPDLLEGAQTGLPRALRLRPLALQYAHIGIFPQEMCLHVMHRAL
uniref:Uncharacterized protein n=1 Tax=Thermogemmatispora argillosa TaxID=2045280 RepID=A0A455T6R0_9CHLR|nr:hypothetical protein KTA_36210 [Thermogemmatispora argillosa]